jgi:hypothetical protein
MILMFSSSDLEAYCLPVAETETLVWSNERRLKPVFQAVLTRTGIHIA